MLKTILCLATLGASILLSVGEASAQDLPAPAGVTKLNHESSTPPKYCNPCLFYGGDFDPSNFGSEGDYPNENTIAFPDTTVYVPFGVPLTQHWEITGLFVNVLSTEGGILDPQQATWSISNAMSSGNQGNLIASGVAKAQELPTGRTVLGYPEYTIAVNIPRVELGFGEYWLTVVPQCTVITNGACGGEFALSSTDGLNAYGSFEAPYQGLSNSTFYGFNYEPICQEAKQGCKWLSAGAIGRAAAF